MEFPRQSSGETCAPASRCVPQHPSSSPTSRCCAVSSGYAVFAHIDHDNGASSCSAAEILSVAVAIPKPESFAVSEPGNRANVNSAQHRNSACRDHATSADVAAGYDFTKAIPIAVNMVVAASHVR